jgi:hypothetical protein
MEKQPLDQHLLTHSLMSQCNPALQISRERVRILMVLEASEVYIHNIRV